MADPAATSDATSGPDATSGAETEETASSSATQELGDAGKAALAAVRRELRQAQTRVQELEQADRDRQDAERTELEKATTRAESAEQRIVELEHEAMARQAAIDAGIPDAWERLHGTSKDELDADAKAFVERYGQQQQQQERPDLGAGARQSAPATGSTGFSERLRQQARSRR